MTIGEMMKVIERALEVSPYVAMCEDEEAKGHEIIRVGSVDWLPASEWPTDIVIAKAKNTIRIVAIYNRDQGNGAFSRMVRGIQSAGLKPMVVCPSHQMRDILKGWNWRKQMVGTSFHDHEERWFPQRKQHNQ